MSRSYWSGAGSRGGNTYADDAGSPYRTEYDTGATEILTEDYDDYDGYDGYEHRDRRWKWIAGLAAVVLFISVVAIATVLGNDSATSTSSTSTSASAGPVVQDSAPSSTAPRTVIATVPPGPSATAPLAPETVVTVTTTPSASHPAPAPPLPPAEGVAPDRTITYTITGTRQLFDLVTIIYTDEQGFPRTDLNVALPWTRTLVLNPGVETQSVTATSVTGQLNCTITDGTGAVTVAQSNNSLITTCTK